MRDSTSERSRFAILREGRSSGISPGFLLQRNVIRIGLRQLLTVSGNVPSLVWRAR
jgi:hypothetical protein